MKFLTFSRTGTKTFMVFMRTAAICAKRDVSVVTKGSGIQHFSHFSTLIRFLVAQPKERRKLQSPQYCELLMGVLSAAMTLTVITGCGGSSASPPSVAPATPSISPATGTYTGAQQVTMSDATPGATIYYTIDGKVPTTSSAAYTSAISISASSTVQAIAALGGVVSSVASSNLTINPAHPPAKLAFVQQPSNALAGVAISPAVQVMIQDADGNVVATATNPVTIALTVGTGLAGTLTVTPQNGIAAFSNLTLSTVGTYTLSATSSGLTSATSAGFTVDMPVNLAFTVQPSNAFTGTAISPAVQVAIQDADGKTVTADSSLVTLALAGSTNLGGTLTVSAQNGVATFSNLTVSTAGSYMLSATSPNLPPATSANFTVTVAPVTYYLSPAGSDANSGLSASQAWLSPDHPVNCGDTIIAASSTAYDQQNFAHGKWGPVTCSPGAVANVVWLKCEAFDTCKLTATNQDAMWVTSSYWGVQGWEVTATGGQAVCFASFPPTQTANLHHIIFANDIANGCYGAGFEAIPNGPAGTDYFVLVGNIAYNAAQQTTQCGSGITVFEPAESDQLPGTHIYVAGNYTWGNMNGNPCAGGTPTDGEGIIFDTFDAVDYAQQAVMDNNVAFLNGASGFRVVKTTKAPVYVVNNTAFGNNTDHNLNTIWCGEITLQESKGINVANNIARATSATGCGTNPNYALYVAQGDATDVVAANFAFGIAGQNAGQSASPGFSYATSNILGIDPLFVNPPTTNPGPPNCAGSTSVAQCMSSTFAGLLPKTPSAVGLGIQPLGGTPTMDPLFPSWLCNAALPAGLIPNHCP